MLRARSTSWPALVVLAGLLAGPNAIAQEKPKDAAAPAQAKPAGAAAAKDAKKEPDAPKPRIAVFRLAGPVQERPREEVFNFGGETGIPLETLVSRMDKAAKDSSVKAVVILLDQPTVGLAQAEEQGSVHRELAPTRMEAVQNRFANELLKDIVPFVEKNYRPQAIRVQEWEQSRWHPEEIAIGRFRGFL